MKKNILNMVFVMLVLLIGLAYLANAKPDNTNIRDRTNMDDRWYMDDNAHIGDWMHRTSLTIAPYYPQGWDYVFDCNTPGWTPTSYDWYFGDGQKLINITNQNVYHTYTAAGKYKVMCVATDGTHTSMAKLKVQVMPLPVIV